MPMVGSSKDWLDKLGVKDQLEAELAAERFVDSSAGIEDVTTLQHQAIQACESSLNFLAGMCVPLIFQYLFPPVLLAAWQILRENVFKVRDFTQIALGIPRGHGKTTLVKIFVVFCVLFTKKQFILIISSTSAHAENVLADVMDMLSEQNIKKLFGDWKLGKEVDRQDLKKFGFRSRNIIIAAIGAHGSVRGLNIKNARPDVMIFEDIQTKECSESKVESDKLERWLIATAMKAKSPHGCLNIFCGNMYPGPNSILKKLKSNPKWIKFISGAILADGTALWPELRPYQTLIDELEGDMAAGHPEIFFSEVMNDTDVGINTSIDLTRLKAWPWSEHEQAQGKAILIDPSPGKQGKDAVTIAMIEVYDEVPGLRRVVEGAFSPGACIMQALLWCLKYGVKVIAIEANSYQATLGYWFQRECERLQITGIECVEIYSGMHSKNARITMALKSVAANEILLHPDCRSQVLHQISNWNPMKRDNVDGILDTLTFITKVIELYSELMLSDTEVQILELDGAEVQENNHAF